MGSYFFYSPWSSPKVFLSPLSCLCFWVNVPPPLAVSWGCCQSWVSRVDVQVRVQCPFLGKVPPAKRKNQHVLRLTFLIVVATFHLILQICKDQNHTNVIKLLPWLTKRGKTWLWGGRALWFHRTRNPDSDKHAIRPLNRKKQGSWC